MSHTAAVLIFVHKPNLEWFELISLQQCYRVLSGHPLFLVCPRGLNVSRYLEVAPKLTIDHIPAKWMESYDAYNTLKVEPFLYRKYRDYEYLLIYELDAFVFRDELISWCSQSWDYIGAPWFSRPGVALGVGNGGFSLRKTESFLQVLRDWPAMSQRLGVLHRWFMRGRFTSGSLRLLQAELQQRATLAEGQVMHEDAFWCRDVPKRFPSFNIAPVDTAKAFSFERYPKRLYDECNGRLPFGCHKWMKYDPDFWRPVLCSLGYDVSADPQLSAQSC